MILCGSVRDFEKSTGTARKTYIKGFVLSIRFVRFLRVQNKNRSGVCKYMTSFYERAAAITGENRIKTKEPLNRYTTFRIGGEADFMAEPEKPEQIAELVDLCKEENVPFFIMGNGSNLLVSDNGYRGMIIHIAEGMSRIMVGGTKIIAQAGASLIKVAVTAKQHELTGMEFASGIPGSVGGAVYMNAGAYGGEMKHIISSVKVLDQNGQIYDISGSDMEDRKSVV